MLICQLKSDNKKYILTYMNIKPIEEARRILKSLGLSDTETSIYLFGVKYNSLTVSQIAKFGNLGRTNTYHIIKKLMEHGMCTYQSTSYGRRVQFSSFEEVSNLVERKQRELGLLNEEIKEVAQFMQFNKQSGFIQPKVQFFEGTDGVQKLFDQSIIGTHQEVYSILSESGIFDVLGKNFIKDYFIRRSKKNMTSYSLRPYNERKSDHSSTLSSEEFKRVVKFLPKSVSVSTTILLWGESNVSFITSKEEPFGTLLQSHDIYSTLKSLFEVLWDISTDK